MWTGRQTNRDFMYHVYHNGIKINHLVISKIKFSKALPHNTFYPFTIFSNMPKRYSNFSEIDNNMPLAPVYTSMMITVFNTIYHSPNYRLPC